MAENIDINVAFTDSGIEKIIQDTERLKTSTKDLTGNTNELGKSFGGVGQFAKIAGAAFAGIGIADIALNAIKAADAFNLMQAGLKRVSGGDTDVATSKFRELSKIADELGIKNNELVATYTSLAQRGFKPTGDEIKKLIDIAKASNKEVNQLAEAILDAQTGEFERLKEFGIKSKVSGDQITFSFNGVTKTVKNSADEINKAILSFGDLASVQGAAAGAANTLAAAQNRLSNATDALLVNIGQLGNEAVATLVTGFGGVVGSINDVLFPTQALNREFDEQRIIVSGLDKDLPKLTERYKVLSSQKSLNKKEQAELNRVTEDIIKLVPLAAEGFGKYSDGLRVNLDALNKYAGAQKEVYKVLAENEAFLTRGRLTEIKERKSQLEKEQELILRNDNLFLGKRTQKGINDAFKKQKSEFNAITLEELELNKKSVDIQEQLERLSKGQTIELKKNTEETKKNASAKSDLTDAEKKKLEQLKKAVNSDVEKLRADAAKSQIKNQSETNEQLVINQRDLDLKLLAEEQKSLEDKIRVAGLKINVEKEFGDKQLAIIEDSIVKIRAAREKDLETEFGIGKTVTKLKDPKTVVDTDVFKVDENKTLADAILKPKEFDTKFKELNKITKEEVDKLNAEIRRLVPKNADLNAITDPLERLKLKILAALKINEQQAQTIVDQLGKLSIAYLSFFTAKSEASAKAHEEEAKRIDEELALKDKALNIELQRQKDGSANNVDAVKQEIASLEQERRTALDKAAADREKSQKAQLISDGIVQTSNLITSITDIYKGFAKLPIIGLFLGAAAVGGFLLSIAAAKEKARASTKLRDGGLLKGATHEQGGIQIADNYEAENGEFVLNKRVTQKSLPFISKLNKGEFDNYDLNSLVGNNAVTDSVQRSRASQDLADNYNKSIIHTAIVGAIKEQTDALISHDKAKVVYIPKKGGYIEVNENQTGGKRMRHVNLSE